MTLIKGGIQSSDDSERVSPTLLIPWVVRDISLLVIIQSGLIMKKLSLEVTCMDVQVLSNKIKRRKIYQPPGKAKSASETGSIAIPIKHRSKWYFFGAQCLIDCIECETTYETSQ